MVGLLLCILAFATTFAGSRYSLQRGLIAMLFWGYFWGILRANVPVTASYFLFDCGLVGFYAAQWKVLFVNQSKRTGLLKVWTMVLLFWPCVLVFMPFQHPLVSLVGLRGAIFFLPLILAGSMLTDEAILRLSTGIAAFNLVVLAFAAGEYALGVPKFFPENASTQMIYASNDVAGYQYLRIPGTFGAAHVFGGTMVLSLPFLYASWSQPRIERWTKIVLFAGMIAALFGVLMSATRLNFVIGGFLVLCMAFAGKFSFSSRAAMIAALAVLAFVASTNERFGRFKSLDNTEQITDRIHGSVNRGFWEVMYEYPMGNGLGGGGTNIPYFLQGLVRNPVAIESEYGRIMLETGIVGLALWAAFIAWFVVGSAAFEPGPWKTGRRVAWVCCIAYFGVGMIGTGMLTSVPSTALLLIYVGWVAVRPASSIAILSSPAKYRAVRYRVQRTAGIA